MKRAEKRGKLYHILKELTPKLSPNDLARICLLVTKRKSEVLNAFNAGEELLKLLNDPSFQQYGFHTFFPLIDSEKIVTIVHVLCQYNPEQLKQEFLDFLFHLNREERSALFRFPVELFETAFPNFNPASEDHILIPLVENCLELTLDLAMKFNRSQFTIWFQVDDTAGITSFLFSDLPNVRSEHVSVRMLEGTFSGYDYVIAFPPFSGRLPTQVTSEWKRTFRSSSEIKSVPRVDADLYIQRMLRKTEDRSQFIVMAPELFMYSHGSFREIRDHLATNNKLMKIVRLLPGVLEPSSNPPLVLLQFTDYPQSSETEVEILKIEIEKSLRRGNASQFLVTDKKFIGVQTLVNNDVWDLEAIFSQSPAVIIPEIKTFKLGEAIQDIFRGVSTESPERGSPSRIERLRVVGLSEMVSDITDVDSIEPTDVGLNTPPDRYLLKDDDVVLTCRGTAMKVSVIKIGSENKGIPSNNVAVMRVNPERIDPYFLYGFLVSKAGKQALNARQSGAGQKVLSLKDLRTIDIPMVPIIEQRKMAQEYRDASERYKAEKRRLDEEFQKKVESFHRKMGVAI